MNKKATILLVEDDENLGFVLQDYLQLLDYEVILEKDGEAGYNTYKLKQQEIDLCLFDAMLPLKDGFTLAEEIKASAYPLFS